MEINEYIVVGSGCCGVMAAKTLVDKGVQVLMLDAGKNENAANNSFQKSFIDFRLTETNQEEVLLGKNFESLTNLFKTNPLHLTANRHIVIDGVNELLQWHGNDFLPTESLATGGLGNAWGLGSYVYSDNEIKETGLPVNKMKEAYKWVSKFVGISGGNDESANYATGNLFTPQKAIPLDFSGQSLYKKRTKKLKLLQKKGFTVGRTPLAVSTENTMNGEMYKEDDWDFYNTQPSSGYRPIYTLNQLKAKQNFKYKGNQLVLKFNETGTCVEIETIDILTKELKKYYCKKLIISSGTLGTARIAMRSLNIDKLPIICNPYHTIPSLQLKHLGTSNVDYQTGLAQLSLYYDEDGTHTRVAMGSLYSYRSLMAFRLLKELPLDAKTGMQFLKLLQPAFNVTGVFFPEYGSNNKYIQRINDSNSITGDSMTSYYQLSDVEKRSIIKTKKKFKRALFNLGTIPLNSKQNPNGASIHYGGTLPFTINGKKGFLNSSNGKLNGFKNVYVADGSGFAFLSGKGLTLTLMAYAHLVANNASKPL